MLPERRSNRGKKSPITEKRSEEGISQSETKSTAPSDLHGLIVSCIELILIGKYVSGGDK